MDKNIITFGKYKNSTYIEVYKNDPNYCNWILNLKNANIKVMKFQKHIKYFIENDKVIISKNKYTQCIICNETTNKKKILNCCNNEICNICLIKINNFKCPFCRSIIENELDFYTKEIKKYIIEKDKKLIEQDYIIKTYINKYIEINNRNTELLYFLKRLISTKDINKKNIILILKKLVDEFF